MRDSIRTILAKAHAENRQDLIDYWHHALAYEFSITNEYDSSLIYYHKSANGPKPDSVLLAETYNAMGVIFSTRDYLDSSIHYYMKARQIYQKKGDLSKYAHIAANLAILYKDQALYQNALDIAFETIKVLEPGGPSRELASCYNTVATVYKKLDEYEEALDFQKNALSVRKTLQLTKGVAQSYSNIGETFIHLKLYDSAMVNLEKSLVIKRYAGDKKALPATLNNMGVALTELQRFPQAEKILLEAASITVEHEDRQLLAETLTYLARLYALQGKFTEAIPYITRSEKVVREIGALNLLAEILELKIAALKFYGKYAAALQYAGELKAIRDSIFRIEKLEAMFSIQARYESEQKEQEISFLSAKSEAAETNVKAQQRWIMSLSIGIILLAIIAGLIFLLLRVTKNGKRHAETLLEELHHRMKNNLQILSGLLTLHSQELKDEKAIEVVKESESRVNAMALIHKKLYNTKEHRSIDLQDYMNELVNFLIHSYGFSAGALKVKLEIAPIHLDVDKAIPLGLIMNELLSNSFKHAFIDHSHPELTVRISQQKNDLIVNVADNGNYKDFTTSSSVSDSFGMKMVTLLTRDLRGTLEVSKVAGTSFHLNIPIT
jgi:two-component sensor histidine kinase